MLEPNDSIDALMERIKNYNSPLTDTQAYNLLVDYYPNKLLSLLKNENNEPSKHDLDIIKEVSKRLNMYPIYEQILEVYKKREEV